jgi:hypothetical protein
MQKPYVNYFINKKTHPAQTKQMFDMHGTSLTRGSTRLPSLSAKASLFHESLIFPYFRGKGATLFSTSHSFIISPFSEIVNIVQDKA